LGPSDLSNEDHFFGKEGECFAAHISEVR
jgi:hypothetical protein